MMLSLGNRKRLALRVHGGAPFGVGGDRLAVRTQGVHPRNVSSNLAPRAIVVSGLCRAKQSFDPHGFASVHSADQRLQQKAGEPCSGRVLVRRALQSVPLARDDPRSTPAEALAFTDHPWSIGELLDAALATDHGAPENAPDQPRRFQVIEGGKA